MGGLMARVGVGLVAVLAVAGFFVVGPAAGPAVACDCGGLSDADAFDRADAVFVGEVAGYEPPGDAEVMSSADPARWTFEVEAVYKGEVTATQTVVSEWSGASCGLEIPRTGEFVVFASRSGSFSLTPEPGEYYAGLCGGTRSTAQGPLAVDVEASPPAGFEATAMSSAASGAASTDGGAGSAGPSSIVILTAGLALVAVATVIGVVLVPRARGRTRRG